MPLPLCCAAAPCFVSPLLRASTVLSFLVWEPSDLSALYPFSKYKFATLKECSCLCTAEPFAASRAEPLVCRLRGSLARACLRSAKFHPNFERSLQPFN